MTSSDYISAGNAKRLEDAVRKHKTASTAQPGVAELVTQFMRGCVKTDGTALLAPDECAVRIGDGLQIQKTR